MLFVSFVDIVDADGPEEVIQHLQGVQENSISSVNWPELYPSKPNVSFKIAHNNDSIFIHYFVEEDELLADVAVNNGEVYTDSCVEFFISLDEGSYYNAEFSCIGKALLGYRKNGEKTIRAGRSVLEKIKRYSSLGENTFGRKKGDFRWDMLIVIPVAAFWQSELKSMKGTKLKANFYKCGDFLTKPHYLSWIPVKTISPNFHKPEYFGALIFE